MLSSSSSSPSRNRTLYEALWAPSVRSWLEKVPVARRIYSGWTRRHPFDIRNGIDASGFLSADECAADSPLAGKVNPYGGSQPSIVRRALLTLPQTENYVFVDIGCGKGRPLVVASEFPFRRIVGVELSKNLAQVAQANAHAVASAHPQRTPIEIEIGDATTIAPHGERVVYFIYNSFPRPLVEALVKNLESRLGKGLAHAFFIYYNPVHAGVLDDSQHFSRWTARTFPYAQDELGYGPDIEDTLVIWQSQPSPYAALPDADRRIVVNRGTWCSLAEH